MDLFVINDAPYGDERPYNAMLHAMNLVKSEGVQVKVFLVADAVYCARKDQKPPESRTFRFLSIETTLPTPYPIIKYFTKAHVRRSLPPNLRASRRAQVTRSFRDLLIMRKPQ